MKILKFGGTSIGSSHRIKNIIPLINNNDKKIVVLSSISGTTNHLERFVELINNKELDRSIVGQCGSLISKVFYIKKIFIPLHF